MIHPRPSPIAAALYTLRDLGVDVIILHGPSGCCFRTGRLLEDEGVRVVTTAMTENEFIFGASEKLIDTIIEAYNTFHPESIGIVGTCASMIIGENMKEAARLSDVKSNLIVVETHGGYSDGANTTGAILTLNAAKDVGLIREDEVQRQTSMLEKATELEKTRGMAKGEYIQPDYGDNKVKVAQLILKYLKEDKKVAIVLNAKKETSFLFGDIMTINWDKYTDNIPYYIANTNENIGLKYIKNHAITVNNTVSHSIDKITGGLDEYPITGEVAEIEINKLDFDLVVVLGVPHAVNPDNIKAVSIAVTDGPRLVKPLKDMGYDYVVTELDAHSKTLGAKSIVESEFASVIRGLIE